MYLLEQINLSDLARRYGVPNKNNTGNVVVKEFLESEGIDLKRFNQLRKNQRPNIRRKLKRMLGGEISVPVPRTNTAIKNEFLKKIESGEYELGDIIVPRQYKKIVLTPEGNVEEETFTVSGRHLPLYDIRDRLLKQHDELGLVRDHSTTHYEGMTPEEVVDRLNIIQRKI